MLIGYARVFMEGQTLALQHDTLRGAGCDAVFDDHGVSGAAKHRPGLLAALDAAKPGDVLVA